MKRKRTCVISKAVGKLKSPPSHACGHHSISKLTKDVAEAIHISVLSLRQEQLRKILRSYSIRTDQIIGAVFEQMIQSTMQYSGCTRESLCAGNQSMTLRFIREACGQLVSSKLHNPTINSPGYKRGKYKCSRCLQQKTSCSCDTWARRRARSEIAVTIDDIDSMQPAVGAEDVFKTMELELDLDLGLFELKANV